MSHFAKIENGLVTEVIVAEQDFINLLDGEWVQTSYNTHGNQHPENRPLRKNFAGIGFTYDKNLDAFIPPKPFNSWTLNQEIGLWEAPTPMPKDGKFYKWNEPLLTWIEI